MENQSETREDVMLELEHLKLRYDFVLQALKNLVRADEMSLPRNLPYYQDLLNKANEAMYM